MAVCPCHSGCWHGLLLVRAPSQACRCPLFHSILTCCSSIHTPSLRSEPGKLARSNWSPTKSGHYRMALRHWGITESYHNLSCLSPNLSHLWALDTPWYFPPCCSAHWFASITICVTLHGHYLFVSLWPSQDCLACVIKKFYIFCFTVFSSVKIYHLQ